MLTELEIKKVLLEACSTGADFAELYFENTTDEMTHLCHFDFNKLLTQRFFIYYIVNFV